MPGSDKLVLIIDDDAGLTRLMEKGLSRLGYRIESAHTGGEGMRRIAEGRMDAVVLDHHLPDLEGLQILDALKEVSSAPPVIYLSGVQDPAIAVAAIKAGAYDYVTKDVHEDFITLLDHTLKSTFKAEADRKAKERAEAELRESRDRYRELAEERALLIREVHHRVGNSLAIVIAILRMQRAACLGGANEVLADAEARVRAIANVQANLYTQDSVKRLRLDQYLASLISDLRQSLEDGRLEIVLDASPAAIDADRAVALGLLMSELLINAKKHAYPDGKGQVRVRLSPKSAGDMELIVEDDGVGSAAKTAVEGAGVGKKIIAAMATKLGGTLKFDPGHKGTRAVLAFRI